MHYLPCTIAFSGNQPSLVVLVEDQSQPLSCVSSDKEMNEDSVSRLKFTRFASTLRNRPIITDDDK